MSNDTAMFLLYAWKESSDIFKCNDRDVEAITETNKALCFFARIDVETAVKIFRLVAHKSNRLFINASETNHNIFSHVFMYFITTVFIHDLIDHLFNIIRARRLKRNDLCQIWSIFFIKRIWWWNRPSVAFLCIIRWYIIK